MHEYDSTLDAALHYASLGWKLFPVYGASNPDLAKHPVIKETPHWHQDSTSDPKQLIAWFTGTSYGIGLDCGKSGVFVLDGDRLEAVPSNLNLEPAWSLQGNPERKSWIFKQPEESLIGCSTGNWNAGEVKGDGGYVVLPPSFHPVGGSYVWLEREGSMDATQDVLSMLTLKTSPKSSKLLFATTGEPCKVLSRVYAKHSQILAEAGKSGSGRFPAMRDAAYAIAACGSEGHRGASQALKSIRESYYLAVGSDRSKEALRAEWHRAISKLGDEFSDRTPKPCGGDSCGELETIDVGDDFERAVESRIEVHRVNEEARRRISLQGLENWNPVQPTTIDYLQSLSETEDRIENLLNVDGTCLLVAQRKTGKTTFISNVVRSLLDGSDLMDIYTVNPSNGPIGLFDLEMTPALLGKWFGRMPIQNRSNLKIFACRGNISRTFSTLISDFDSFVEWLKRHEIATWIIDPLAPLLSSLGMDENNNSDIRRLLTMLRDAGTQAGIGEILLSHHAGWGSSTRARGASAFEDMVDVIWRLEFQGEDRAFSTLGRLGNIPITKIVLDPQTGLLSLEEFVHSI